MWWLDHSGCHKSEAHHDSPPSARIFISHKLIFFTERRLAVAKQRIISSKSDVCWRATRYDYQQQLHSGTRKQHEALQRRQSSVRLRCSASPKSSPQNKCRIYLKHLSPLRWRVLARSAQNGPATMMVISQSGEVCERLQIQFKSSNKNLLMWSHITLMWLLCCHSPPSKWQGKTTVMSHPPLWWCCAQLCTSQFL